jgi:hypothetical protein
MAQLVTEARDDIARLEKKIDQVIELLTGNGAPERGLIVRLDRVERFLMPLGYGSPNGIDDRVRSLEHFRASVESVTWRILVPIIVSETLAILAFIGGVLTHTIKVSF